MVNKKKWVLVKVFIFFMLVSFLSSCDQHGTEKEDSSKVAGVSDTEILLGSSAALTGHAGFLGTQYLHGAQAYINEVNENGGVHGRQIKIIALDDQYNPTKTIANTQKLITDNKVFTLFNYVGTPTSVAVKPTISSAKIPVFGFFTGAESLRKPVDPYFFHLRDSYYAEAEGAIAYFVDRKKMKRVGVFYQEDSFGIAVLKGIQLALHRRGMEPVVTDTFMRGSLDIKDAVTWINQVEVDVVMMVGTYAPLAKFVKMTHDLGKSPYFSTVSFVGSRAYSKELIEIQKIDSYQYAKIMVTQVVPSPYSETSSATSEYYALSIKHYPDDSPNYVAFEGFLNAKVLITALQNVGRDLNRDSLRDEILALHDLDIGIGKKVDFGVGDQQGLSGIYYSRLGDKGWFDTFGIEEGGH